MPRTINTAMTTTFPDDVDGQALQRLVEMGCDLSKPMDVDIQVAVADEETAFNFSTAATALGYRTDVFFDEEIEDVEEASEPWTCECSKVIVIDYDSIMAAQAELNDIAEGMNGYVDGWSTYGNADG